MRENHGLCSTPEYAAWANMIRRCENPKNPRYANYGGRGIYVCVEWRLSFERFLDDVGFKPSLDHSLERKNNDGPYEPGNVIWATIQEQAKNKRPPRCRICREQGHNHQTCPVKK